MWDLAKFDTTPFFIGYYEKGCRNNTLTVIGSFKDPDFRGKFSGNSWRVMDERPKLLCDIFKSKCRLCGGKAERKNYFFSDAGKSLELKKIVFRLCEIVVSESDKLPKYCCRSCCEKLTRLNRNIEAFASTCKAAQKVLEGDLIASRQSIRQKRYRSGNTPTSTEKPRKLPCTMVTASVRKSLSYDKHQSDTLTSLLQEKEASKLF